MKRLKTIVLITAATLYTLLPQSWGQEFRIETELYFGDARQPMSQNLTLFSNGMIYDFQMSSEAQPTPIEITIFDTRKRSFVLLDIKRKIRLQMDGAQLIKVVEGLRRDTLQNKDTKFLANPMFEEHHDVATNWVQLASPQIEYRFTGEQPKDISILPIYHEFLDYYTMMNATDPTKLPPFPRMRLNQSIKKYGWIPSEVRIAVRENDLFQRAFKAATKHTVMLELSKQDRARIDTAKSHWMSFEEVTLARYRGLSPKEATAD